MFQIGERTYRSFWRNERLFSRRYSSIRRGRLKARGETRSATLKVTFQPSGDDGVSTFRRTEKGYESSLRLEKDERNSSCFIFVVVTFHSGIYFPRSRSLSLFLSSLFPSSYVPDESQSSGLEGGTKEQKEQRERERERFKHIGIERGVVGDWRRMAAGIEGGETEISAARDIEEGNISIDVRFIELRPREMANAANRVTCHFAGRFCLLAFFAFALVPSEHRVSRDSSSPSGRHSLHGE